MHAAHFSALKKRRWLLRVCAAALCLGCLAGCNPLFERFADTPTPTLPPTETIAPSLTPTETVTPTLTPTVTETLTITPSVTPTLTLQPTYAVLRGEVNAAQVMCFYGPSKAYLFKYTLIGGSHLDVIGYMPDTGYIEVQAIGGNNPCWMNLEWMDVEGDINAVAPVDSTTLVLPQSPYYGPLSSASATRSGNDVTVTFSLMALRAGDDSEQELYLVEAWVCRGGRLTFVPTGSRVASVTIRDEPGCSEPSHARVYGVEKHGYTRYIEISWPAAGE